MLILLSPAKKQNFDDVPDGLMASTPQAMPEIKTLVTILKSMSAQQLKALMNISDKLADLNYQRYQDFKPNTFNLANSKQAVLAFHGDVYQSLSASTFTQKDFAFAQQRLMILSGLYGALKPMDLIQPYRLEMKTALSNKKGNNLYAFWGDTIAKAINQQLAAHRNKTIINLASKEYFNAVDLEVMDSPVLTIHFKEKRDGKLKVLGMNAKRARGMMARFIIENKLNTPTKIKEFNVANYAYRDDLSDDSDWVFVR